MPRDSISLERFVRAVHRRQVFLRVLERAGLGLLAGCGVAAVLGMILLSRGRDAWTVSVAALAVGAVVGAIWGIARRPTPLLAASEADRQLSTADLLSTAWSIRQSDDPWHRSILALATARCESSSPSTVLLHRFGLRAWGGIALAVAFVATLAALSSTSLDASRSAQSVAGARSVAKGKPLVEIALAPTPAQHRVEQSPGDDRRIGSDLSEDVPATDADESNAAPPGDDREQMPSASSPGTGAAQAKSDVPDLPLNKSDQVSADFPPGTSPSATTKTASGAGRAVDDPATTGSATAGIVQPEPSAEAVPPWQLDSWPQAVESADRAVRSGRVPDAYRDLVREYFDRTAFPGNAGQR